MNYKYNIYSPSGNDTALVETIPSKATQKLLNNKIMQKWPNIEQVGFIDIASKRLEMAGGEFCGNATRCATFEILGGYPGNIDIKVSGVASRIKAGVSNDYKTWTQIPIYKDINNLTETKYGYVVPMQGITHVVTTQKFLKLEIKTQALSILKKLNLTNSPAAGVMFVSNNKNCIKIDPVVWVRDIETLFYETACASGTAAVGLVEAMKQRKSILNQPFIQPSGNLLYTSTQIENGLVKESVISGTIIKPTNEKFITIP